LIKKKILFVEEGRPSKTGGFGGSFYSMLETISLLQNDSKYEFAILTYYEVPAIYDLIDTNTIKYDFVIPFDIFLNLNKGNKYKTKGKERNIIPFFIKTDLLMYLSLVRVKSYLKIINKIKPDLIWGNNMTSGNFTIFISSVFKGIPYIQHQRAELSCISLNYLITLFLSKKIIAITNYVQSTMFNNKIIKYFFFTKSIVVHNFNENFKNIKQFPKERVKDIRLIFMGRLIPQKNIEEFLFIVTKIHETIDKETLKVEIYGDWEDETYKQDIFLLVENSGINSIVNFNSFSKKEDIFINDKLNFLFHTTRKETPEPFGRVLLDAISHGAIVVTNGYGGAGEVIEHKINGIIYNIDNLSLLLDLIKVYHNNTEKYFLSLNKFYLNTCNHFSGIEQYKILNSTLNKIFK
jgi:glycosyltransferase involved in cell wall biosynthesis